MSDKELAPSLEKESPESHDRSGLYIPKPKDVSSADYETIKGRVAEWQARKKEFVENKAVLLIAAREQYSGVLKSLFGADLINELQALHQVAPGDQIPQIWQGPGRDPRSNERRRASLELLRRDGVDLDSFYNVQREHRARASAILSSSLPASPLSVSTAALAPLAEPRGSTSANINSSRGGISPRAGLPTTYRPPYQGNFRFVWISTGEPAMVRITNLEDDPSRAISGGVVQIKKWPDTSDGSSAWACTESAFGAWYFASRVTTLYLDVTVQCLDATHALQTEDAAGVSDCNITTEDSFWLSIFTGGGDLAWEQFNQTISTTGGTAARLHYEGDGEDSKGVKSVMWPSARINGWGITSIVVKPSEPVWVMFGTRQTVSCWVDDVRVNAWVQSHWLVDEAKVTEWSS